MTTARGADPVLDRHRLAVVRHVLSVDVEGSGLDRLVGLAARVLDVPAVMVSLLEADREVIPASVGLPEPLASAGQAPLASSVCAAVVRTGVALVVPDARTDPRTRGTPAVVKLGAGAYAGMPVRRDALVLGALCAMDTGPRTWGEDDLQVLEDLAAAVSAELALRSTVAALQDSQAELRRLNAELHEQSRTDHLTGVANRRAFQERLEAEVARVRRHPAPLSLALIDVDAFKRINDTLGHAVGDQVLVGVSQRVAGALRRSDVLARIGGDEFAVVLPDTPWEAADVLARRVTAAVRAGPVAGIDVTVSVGTATAPPAQGPDELFTTADAALYDAKSEP